MTFWALPSSIVLLQHIAEMSNAETLFIIF